MPCSYSIDQLLIGRQLFALRLEKKHFPLIMIFSYLYSDLNSVVVNVAMRSLISHEGVVKPIQCYGLIRFDIIDS